MTENGCSSSPDELFAHDGPLKIITISGANKDIGKSSLAAYLAAHCRACAGMKVSIHSERLPGEAIVEEKNPPDDPETDTGRMVRAGACPVFWVRSTGEDVTADFAQAVSRVEAPVVIVEGNSVLDELEPAYAVFIMNPTFDDFKPSAFRAIKKAHTVVVNGERDLTGTEVLQLEREIKKINPKAKTLVVAELGRERVLKTVLSRAIGRVGGDYMSAETEDKVKEAVKAKAQEGRLPCALALKLAEELGVPTIEVGNAANELDIKIVKCSLGCF
jgi:hypothetical protein